MLTDIAMAYPMRILLLLTKSALYTANLGTLTLDNTLKLCPPTEGEGDTLFLVQIVASV